MRRFWTPDEQQCLRDWYPWVPTADLADALSMPVQRLLSKAGHLGLRKSRELIAEIARAHSLRPDHGGHRTRFHPGQPAWNKGTHFIAGGRSAETRFKPGRAASAALNYKPIGSLRINPDGALERKVTDDPVLAPARRWVPVARLVWEAAHGQIPPGMSVVFRDGMRTTDPERIVPAALELVTRAELMRRNSIHARTTPEIARIVQLRGVLTRQINLMTKEASTP